MEWWQLLLPPLRASSSMSDDEEQKSSGNDGKEQQPSLSLLLIDSYDSFTYNLVQLFATLNHCHPPTVLLNDAPWEKVQRLCEQVDAVVIGAGPGNPHHAADLGVISQLLQKYPALPIFGVCLGLQALMVHYGGSVVASSAGPMHGQCSKIRHSDAALFQGVPQHFDAVRYNSLNADINTMPSQLRVTATAETDGAVMAVEVVHDKPKHAAPQWAVQFHPESVRSQYGREMIANWLTATRQFVHASRICSYMQGCKQMRTPALPRRALRNTVPSYIPSLSSRSRLRHKRVVTDLTSKQVYTELYAKQQTAYWLDTSKADTPDARYSYMGDATGDYSYTLSYCLRNNTARIVKHRQVLSEWQPATDIFDDIQNIVNQHRSAIDDTIKQHCSFALQGGLVGYLSYEMRHVTMPQPNQQGSAHSSPDRSHNCYPDVLLLLSDRYLVHDEHENVWHVMWLETDADDANALWAVHTEQWLGATTPHPIASTNGVTRSADIDTTWKFDVPQYTELIEECQRQLRAGESYELCLTNRVTIDHPVDAYNLYQHLRRINPAPYAAYMSFGLSPLPDSPCNHLHICCSSPERFTRIRRRNEQLEAECKPIKGTIERGETVFDDKERINDLTTSEKDQAENLMIVDLIRNDLGTVCEVGSVKVTKLMAVETYATVHQLVSTIQGRIDQSRCDAVDCVKTLFPPGSMTGAPKLRSCQILDKVEMSEPRGIYSGALGFFSFSGEADFNVVIRTVVVEDHERLSLGCGGAIVHLSDPAAECAEVLLKARAPLEACKLACAATDQTNAR